VNSLRARIAILTALVALLAVSVSALAGVHSTRLGVREQRMRGAVQRLEDVRIRLDQAIAGLGHEVEDYAGWDELYEHMPVPAPAWTAINLVPGKNPGGLTQVFAIVLDGRLVGRYRFGSAPHGEPDADDPAPSADLVDLAGRPSGEGVGVFGGRPVLWAIRRITRSDGTGRPRGTLIGLAYITPAVVASFQFQGWSLEMSADTSHPEGTGIAFADDRISASRSEAGIGGGLRVTASEQGGEAEAIAFRANNAIAIAGLATALLATLAGVALGLHWVRPIHRLAEACRQRAIDPGHPLPVDHDLDEATVLGAALNDLVAAERRHRDELAAALDREITANAVHRRFLAQLGHEFGGPLRQLTQAVDRLAGNDGRLPPEEVAAASQVAQLLEERFQEVLGLAAGHEEATGGSERDLSDYLAGIAEMLHPVAQRRAVELRIETAGGRVMIDARLLTPVLVNLAANAIAASRQGGVVLGAQRFDDGSSAWTVGDTGSGLPDPVTAALGASGPLGPAMPEAPGLGMGLALVLANVHALGGRLQVVSTGPQGTVIRVDIPVRQRTGVFAVSRTPPHPQRYVGGSGAADPTAS
jgi:signal transduction histidine kinase